MDICACPNYSASLPSSSSSSSSSSSFSSSYSSSSFLRFEVSSEKVIKFCSLGVSKVISKLSYAFFGFIFIVVGATLGAMTGALIGLKTQRGFVRWTIVGAINGAIFFIEVIKTLRALWHSDNSRMECFISLMGAVEKAFEEVPSSGFETHCAKRLSRRSVDEKIPKIRITGKDVLDDASGDRISCSICLQEFQLGEMGRSLPQCHHMFHLCCIDKWLLVHGSCPLCRRDLNLTHSADNGNRSG